MQAEVGTVLDGFGVLIPRSEKIRTLGTVWNSSLFPDRGGEGRVTLTSFVGGATDPEIVAKQDEEIEAIVQDENARILEITGQPVVSRVWKHPKALPQYNLGHGHVVETVRESERAIPGLYFAGNYLEGPSIGKCVDRGSQTRRSREGLFARRGCKMSIMLLCNPWPTHRNRAVNFSSNLSPRNRATRSRDMV